MALTRANIETILVKRTSKLMVFVGMDGTTVDGTNADLDDPIGVAIRDCGGSVDNFTDVDDDDITTVDSAKYDQLIDIAEYRLLNSILGNFDKYGLKVGPRSGYQSQVREGVEVRLKQMRKDLEAKYGYNAPTPSVGYIERDFAEHNEDLPS